MDENLLKELYHLGEKDHDMFKLRTIEEIIEERYFPKPALKNGLSRLKRRKFVEKIEREWKFTELGAKKGRRMVKLHRLWELYLSTYLKIAPDHVHEDAETIEHIITPELEATLERILEYPESDPHQSEIPY